MRPKFENQGPADIDYSMGAKLKAKGGSIEEIRGAIQDAEFEKITRRFEEEKADATKKSAKLRTK